MTWILIINGPICQHKSPRNEVNMVIYMDKYVCDFKSAMYCLLKERNNSVVRYYSLYFCYSFLNWTEDTGINNPVKIHEKINVLLRLCMYVCSAVQCSAVQGRVVHAWLHAIHPNYSLPLLTNCGIGGCTLACMHTRMHATPLACTHMHTFSIIKFRYLFYC